MNKILIVFVLLFFFTVTASAIPSYTVTEAGTTAANGDYSVYSTCTGATSYKHDTNEVYMFRAGIWFLGSVHCNNSSGTYYSNGASGENPETGNGWEVAGGTAPAAVLSAYSIPEFFGIHFEWIDLSSGLIAAVLAIGLPMFLYKRKKQ